MYVYPSVVPQETNRHQLDEFLSIWYLKIFRKTIEKIQSSLKSDENNEFFLK